MSDRETVISLPGYKRKKSAQRGFREWRRLFRTFHAFDENTRWSGLPDWVILFLSEDSPEGRLTVYDLLMGALDLGSGHGFETLPGHRLMPLMDAYFIIMDQIRFECMRRLGWIEEIPWADKSIIEQVLAARDISSPFMLKTPRMTCLHPGFNKMRGEGDPDYERLLRMHIPDAIRAFTRKLHSKMTDRKRAALKGPDQGK